MMAGISTEERVAALEAIQKTVERDLQEIKTNHLPHIEQKVDGLRNWIMGALFTSLAILIQNFLR